MKERPILFNAPMVRAILDGTKTQTRRIVRPRGDICLGNRCVLQPHELAGEVNAGDYDNSVFGQPGDHLWVRETFCPIYPQDPAYNGGQPIEYDYAATYQHGNRLGDHLGVRKVWKPSIHMPRVASRILLEVTSVRIEKLQDISGKDAVAEGIVPHIDQGMQLIPDYCIKEYRDLWKQINGAGSWDLNPWVWVIAFQITTGKASPL